MGDVVTLRPKVTTDEYFGGCPHCGQNDGYLNIGRDHWFRCNRHKTKWWTGSNLFSSWHDEDEGVWTQNRFKLAEYMTVESIHPEPNPEEEREVTHRLNYESAVMKALGVVLQAGEPIDPNDPFSFLRHPHKDRPDRLYILTADNTAYDLDRAAAYTAYEASRGGDKDAIPTLLAQP